MLKGYWCPRGCGKSIFLIAHDRRRGSWKCSRCLRIFDKFQLEELNGKIKHNVKKTTISA